MLYKVPSGRWCGAKRKSPHSVRIPVYEHGHDGGLAWLNETMGIGRILVSQVGYTCRHEVSLKE